MNYLAYFIENTPTWPFTIIVALLGILGGFVVHRFKNRINAAAIFRASIRPEAFTNLRGHQLHNALIESLPVFKAAVHEFRYYLGCFDRLSLNNEWKKYNGGDEKHPDFFKMYCIPVHGPDLLKERLEKLKSIGNKR